MGLDRPGQLATHLAPVRVREHALPLSVTGKQPQIPLALGLIRNVVPTEPELIRSIDHRLKCPAEFAYGSWSFRIP